jgi:iron complex outermembrane receptor protein
MRAQNINGTEQLDRVVPSLTFKRGTANVNSAIAIRGIGTQTFASGAEPSVSAVIDGVVYGRSGMATQDFADVDRIEVLRGPQGTLFGKNASAGALNIITKNPADHLSIDASAAYFGKNEFRATGTVSGPLSANVRALISGYYGYYDGSAVNVYNHDRVNGYKRYGIKAKVIADLGDLRLTLAGDSSHNKDDCCADILGAVNATGNAQWTNLVLPAQLPVVPGWGNRSVNNNFNPGTIDTNRGVSLTADWKFGDGYTLTSISAYRQWKNEQLRDGDFGSVANTYVAIAGHTAAQAATQLIDQRDWLRPAGVSSNMSSAPSSGGPRNTTPSPARTASARIRRWRWTAPASSPARWGRALSSPARARPTGPPSSRTPPASARRR